MINGIDDVYDQIIQISPPTGSLENRCIKLTEEVGELSAEVLKLSGYKRSDLSKNQIERNILLESCDCLIMTLDILIRQGFTKKEINTMCNSQLNKWKKQI